eukprot:CAMPEP_0168430728 /NCGR_PEP_ID=MMETSP0228-20121227/38024_1 /TAXON_ID=133427 /ORGANISM="Protoceratium reticulatum, Strain CCCM 535 (=CCMP 1889)" /LENGTH=414 /DNA_ID=CAMNT_0008444831 /DNA_START=48 /DNA_END=1292 /DNA_ORIENTATION=-
MVYLAALRFALLGIELTEAAGDAAALLQVGVGTTGLLKAGKTNSKSQVKRMGANPPPNSALVVIDMQHDFIVGNPETGEGGGSLGVAGSLQVVGMINQLLKKTWDLKIFTADRHPINHISFASRYTGKNNAKGKPIEPFVSQMRFSYTSKNEFCRASVLEESEGSDLEPTVIEETVIEQGKCEDEMVRSFDQPVFPDHCIAGTPGAELHSALEVQSDDILVFKGTDEYHDSFGAIMHNIDMSHTDPNNIVSMIVDMLKWKNIENVFVVGLALDYCVKSTLLQLSKVSPELNLYLIADATRAVVEVTSPGEGDLEEMQFDGTIDAIKKNYVGRGKVLEELRRHCIGVIQSSKHIGLSAPEEDLVQPAGLPADCKQRQLTREELVDDMQQGSPEQGFTENEVFDSEPVGSPGDSSE